MNARAGGATGGGEDEQERTSQVGHTKREALVASPMIVHKVEVRVDLDLVGIHRIHPISRIRWIRRK